MSKVTDAIIQEAMQRGEFDDLPGSGKPLDLTDYFNTPEDIRIAYSILKSAGLLPEEVELLKEMESIKSQLDSCSDERKHRRLIKELDKWMLKFNLLMDRQKSQRKEIRL